MKKVNLFLLIIIVALISSFIAFFFIEKNRIVQVDRFVMDVNVTDSNVIGMNVDKDGFHFGSLGRGQGSIREMTIKDTERDVMVSVIKEGEMADWVNHPNDFIVREGEVKNITVSVSVPSTAPLGDYSGEIVWH